MAYGKQFNVNVGDEVGMVRCHHYSGDILYSQFGTVSKVNGHGHITVQWGDGEKEKVFDKTGDAYKDKYGPRLVNADDLRNQLELSRIKKERVRIAREMKREIEDGFAHSGRFFPTQTRIAKLKELLSQLEQWTE